MRLTACVEEWAFRTPFRIARGEQQALAVVVVTAEHDGVRGRGEAAGVDYDGETIASILDDIADVSATRQVADLDREALIGLLPPGGARNAIDCALWDLRAKLTGVRAWQAAGLAPPAPLLTACTIGLGDIAEIRAKAQELAGWPLIKVKLDADRHLEPLAAIREACPDARFIVDPNQAWDIDQLNRLAPALAAAGVALIEQPVRRGDDAVLADYRGTIPLAADESCTDRASLAALAGLYSVINIKLDKTGGLTEALALAAAARAAGLGIMVGCMAGTSLAMAPALLVAQGAAFVDLDGPLLHAADRPHGLAYSAGMIAPATPELWG